MAEERPRNPIRHPELVWRILDDELVIVRPGDGEIRVLNGVGSFVWQSLAAERDVAALAELIVGEYDISLEQAQADVASFVSELAEDRLILWQE